MSVLVNGLGGCEIDTLYTPHPLNLAMYDVLAGAVFISNAELSTSFFFFFFERF